MATISGSAEQVIFCKGVEPASLRTLDACKECPHHGGVEEVRAPGHLKKTKEDPGMPPSHRVICGLPTKIMVANLIREK